MGDGFCSAPCPKQAQGASTTRSARQIAADFIVRTRKRRAGVASKAYQPEHDPEKWVPVFGTTSPSPCRFFDGCARPPVTPPLAHVSWHVSWHVASVSVHQDLPEPEAKPTSRENCQSVEIKSRASGDGPAVSDFVPVAPCPRGVCRHIPCRRSALHAADHRSRYGRPDPIFLAVRVEPISTRFQFKCRRCPRVSPFTLTMSAASPWP